MQAVILAAGKGTRMRPLTYNMPKPMVPLLGKPKLEHTFEMLPGEIDEIILIVNYLGEQIEKYFGEKFGNKKIHYVFQKELNGTGGAIHSARDFLRDEFLVMMGDDLYHRKDIETLLQFPLGLVAKKVGNASQFGVVEVDDSHNFAGIVEKPEGVNEGYVNTGLYKLNNNFFDYPLVPISQTEYGLPQTLLSMAKEHPVKVIPATMWMPLGKVEDVEEAERTLAEFMK